VLLDTAAFHANRQYRLKFDNIIRTQHMSASGSSMEAPEPVIPVVPDNIYIRNLIS
jgi:hypothetical protein